MLAYTNANFAVAVILYVALYILQTGFSLPGGALMTLTGGFLFGSVLGTIFVNIGATTGATLAFLAARYVLRDWVERKFGKRIEPIQAGFAQNAFSYLLTLRLIPGLSVFSGQSRVRSDSNTSRHVCHSNLPLALSLAALSTRLRGDNLDPSTRWRKLPHRPCCWRLPSWVYWLLFPLFIANSWEGKKLRYVNQTILFSSPL